MKIRMFIGLLLGIMWVGTVDAVSPYATSILRHLDGNNRMTFVPSMPLFSNKHMNITRPNIPTSPDDSGVREPVPIGGQIPTTKYVQSYMRQYCSDDTIILNNVAENKLPSEQYVLNAAGVSANGNPNVIVTMEYLNNLAKSDEIQCCTVPWPDDLTLDVATRVPTEMNWTVAPDKFPIGHGLDWDYVVYGAGRYIAYDGGDGIIYYSENGTDWNSVYVPELEGFYNNQITYGMVNGRGRFVMTATWNTYTMYSDNGIDWYKSNDLSFEIGQAVEGLEFINGYFWAFVRVSNDYYNPVVLKSPDGITWTEYAKGQYTSNLSDLNVIIPATYDDGTGNKVDGLIGVDNYHNTKTLWYSTDGINWTSRNVMPESAEWDSFVYASDTERFIAMGRNSTYNSSLQTYIYTPYIAYSTDGINWTLGTAPFSGYTPKMAYGNGMFVYLQRIDSNSHQMAYSTNGYSWTNISAANSIKPTDYSVYIKFINGYFYVWGEDFLMRSADGKKWYTIDVTNVAPYAYIYDMAYNGKRLVAPDATSDVVAYSDDGGMTWHKSNPLPEIDDGGWVSITYGNGRFVAVPYIDENAEYTITAWSLDGKTWYPSNRFQSAGVVSVTYGEWNDEDGNMVKRFVAMGVETDIGAWSDDGVTWYPTNVLPVIPPDSDSALVYGNGRFVFASLGDKIAMYSDDGINWNLASGADLFPSAAGLRSMAYGNGRFVVVGINDDAQSESEAIAVAYSDDGKTWHRSTAPMPLVAPIAVSFANGYFIAAGYNMFETFDAMYSADGINWYQSNGLPTMNYAYAVGGGGGKFVSIGILNREVAIGEISFIGGATPWVAGIECNAGNTTIDKMCMAPVVGGNAICKNKTCTCMRTHLIDATNGDFVENANKSSVTVPKHTFATNDECNAQCANICVDNAVNNTDGIQSRLVCGK